MAEIIISIVSFKVKGLTNRVSGYRYGVEL